MPDEFNRDNGNGKTGMVPGGFGPGTMIQPHTQGSSYKEFLEFGKQVRDSLVRTNLLDVNEAVQVAEIICYCQEFELHEDLDMVLNVLALRRSIKMAALLQLLQASTGILSPQMNGYRGQPVGKKHQEDRDDDNRKR